MKILIVEDDFASQQLLAKYLKHEGEIVIADDGEKAVTVFREALENDHPFQLVCLDIMLPLLSGQDVLLSIRQMEEDQGIWGLSGTKVIMLTALHDVENVMQAFRSQCEAYLPKPLNKEKLFKEIQTLGLPLKSSL